MCKIKDNSQYIRSTDTLRDVKTTITYVCIHTYVDIFSFHLAAKVNINLTARKLAKNAEDTHKTNLTIDEELDVSVPAQVQRLN